MGMSMAGPMSQTQSQFGNKGGTPRPKPSGDIAAADNPIASSAPTFPQLGSGIQQPAPVQQYPQSYGQNFMQDPYQRGVNNMMYSYMNQIPGFSPAPSYPPVFQPMYQMSPLQMLRPQTFTGYGEPMYGGMGYNPYFSPRAYQQPAPQPPVSPGYGGKGYIGPAGASPFGSGGSPLRATVGGIGSIFNSIF